MQGLYSPDSFSLGIIIGFFLIVGFCGEGMEAELFKQKEKNIGRQRLYEWGNKLTMLLCVLAGAYIFYKEYEVFVGYFAALLAGAIIGQICVIVVSLMRTLGRGIIYFTGGLSVFVTAYVVWLYYTGEFLQKIGNIDILRYMPGT